MLPRPSRARRAAFTILEILVACLVLGVGVLALASTSVAIARLTGDAARAGMAAVRAQARLEALRAGSCTAASGALSTPGASEWWAAAPALAGESLSDSVRYTQGAQHSLHSELLATAAWCP